MLVKGNSHSHKYDKTQLVTGCLLKNTHVYTLFTAVHGETNRNFWSYLYILFFTTGRQQPIAGVQRGWRVIARDYFGEAASENRNSA